MLSGCSDAVTRVWAADPARAGPAELADVLAATLAARKAEKEAAAAQGGSEGAAGGGGGGGLPPGLKVEEEFALSQPGAKDGENKFIRNSATGVCGWGCKDRGGGGHVLANSREVKVGRGRKCLGP